MATKFDDLTTEELIEYIKHLEEQLNSQKYGLYFDRKATPETIVKECSINIPVLIHDPKKDLVSGGADNLLIEGDNYATLVALNTIYPNGLADIIYIDPPYNRGRNDFKYNDNIVDLDDGFKHTKWLNFMECRLKLARNLLKEDGILFISIDDNEQPNLKILCNQIFGEDNVEQYIWCIQDKTEGSFVKTPGLRVRKEHEYIIACMMNNNKKYSKYASMSQDADKSQSNPDGDPRGPWFSGNMSRNGIKSTTGSKYYTITNPKGISYTRNWTLSEDEYKEALNDNRIFFSRGGAGVPRLKIFTNETKYLIQSSLISDVHTSITGKNELKDIFGYLPFDYPKPTALIKRLIQISSGRDSIVMDFFAGSGTTAQAVLELNKEDGGNRRFILCTNNENNIMTDVCYPRIKTVLTGIRPDGSKYSDGLTGNLRYFKVGFINNDKLKEQARYNLVESCDGLICILEETYELIDSSPSFSVYTNVNKNKCTAIYKDDFNETNFMCMLEKVKAVNASKNIVYYFSQDNNVDPYVESVALKEIPNAQVKPIPAKMYEIYKRISDQSGRAE